MQLQTLTQYEPLTNLLLIILPAKLKMKIALPDNLYAHSLEGHALKDWQRLDSHLNAVAQLAAEFASKFSSSDWAWNAGLLHDLGKVADEFQNYLRRENNIDDPEYDGVGKNKINHSSAGAMLAEEQHNQAGRLFGRVLSYMVAGHHAGLPDFDTCDGGAGALQIRLQEGKKNLDQIRRHSSAIINGLRPLSKLPAFVKQNNFHLWIRLLFSCLVDADFLDTEAFMQPEVARERGSMRDLVDLKKQLDNHLAEKAASCPKTTVNEIRKEILQACRDAAKVKQGIFTLTVPTGGGKTLSAMSFALDHAVLNNKRRVIYVIPFTSIIEQTASTLASIFGIENVVEHHSNLDPDKETPRLRLAAENWDAPIIVTTNVQFFESLLAARTSRTRKLHNLVDSVVVLDEAQLVPPEKLSPCVSLINSLSSDFGVTIVLSTATQPALPKLNQAHEIIPKSARLYERLKRTEIDFSYCRSTPLSWTELAEKLREHEQVLCIVNTRKDCLDLYSLMPQGTIHLSALMCGHHRSEIIREIKKTLNRGEPIRVISTQLVEAGVDIDFPVVYRALAGLDSIAQAAGRCNREGRLDRAGKVVVFNPPKPAPRGLLHKGEGTTKELLTIDGFDPQDPEYFAHYFRLFYSRLNDTGEDYLKDLCPDSATLGMAFRSVAEKFHLINDNAQRPVLVCYGESAKLIDQLRFAGPSRILLRKLQRYTVNLPTRTFERMFHDGLLTEPWPGFYVQAMNTLYDNKIGLNIFTETLPVEDLIL